MVEFLARNKPCLNQFLIPFISPCSQHLLVPASIFHAFVSPCTHLRELPRSKNDHWLLSVTLQWTYNCKCQTNVFLDGKTIPCGNNYTSLFMKHSCFLRVGGWRVNMLSHLYFKCWQTRGRLLNSWNGYQKLHIIRANWSWRKMALEKAGICSSISSTQFNVERENTCSFPCHIGSSIPSFRDMCLHVTVRKKNCFIIFCIILTIYNFF